MSRVRSPAWPRFGELVFGAVGTVGDRPDQGEGLEPFGKDGVGHAGNAPADVVEAAAAAQDFPYDQEGPPTAQHFVGARHGDPVMPDNLSREPNRCGTDSGPSIRPSNCPGGVQTRRVKGRPNVRFGSLADIPRCSRHVRFTPNNGHSSAQVGCPKSAISGHLSRDRALRRCGSTRCRRPRRVATNPLCAMSKRLAGRSTLLDHRYDLSQFRQPTFEACLVDSKVAASELGPRVHRQCAAALGLPDIANHDRVRKSQ